MTLFQDPLFDSRIAEWLDEDPSIAPDRTRDAILASFPSTKQRHVIGVTRRNRTMTNTLRLGLAAAVVVAATLGGIYFLAPRAGPSVAAPETTAPVSSPAPSAAPSATAGALPPNRSTFSSPQYGYTVVYATPYQVIPATELWQPDQIVGDEVWADRYLAPSNAFVAVASQPLPDGMSPDAWMAGYEENAVARDCSVAPDLWTDSTVDGAPARRAEFLCGDTEALELIWVVDNRGWAFTGERAVVDAMVESLQYE